MPLLKWLTNKLESDNRLDQNKVVKNAYFMTTTIYDIDTVIHFVAEMLQFLLWQAPILYILWPHKLRNRGNKGQQQKDEVSASQSDNNTSTSDLSEV